MSKIPKEYTILGIIAVIVIALVILLFKYGSGVTSNAPLINRTDAYVRGPQTAKITLVEFGDFQCPACSAAQPTISRLMSEYAPNIRLVFRHFPLSIHPLAEVAAEAAEAAGAQGKFWEMYDALYAHQSEWGDVIKNISEAQAIQFFSTYAAQIGLDTKKFAADMQTNPYRSNITTDLDDGNKSGVNATPTFFVNGTISPDPSYSTLKGLIDQVNK